MPYRWACYVSTSGEAAEMKQEGAALDSTNRLSTVLREKTTANQFLVYEQWVRGERHVMGFPSSAELASSASIL